MTLLRLSQWACESFAVASIVAAVVAFPAQAVIAGKLLLLAIASLAWAVGVVRIIARVLLHFGWDGKLDAD